jgi:glutathione synthase/RimK-type ligase-like ATP-grasp enzyme
LEIYDFGLGWMDDGEEYLFVKELRSECNLRGLRFIVVDEKSIDKISEDIKKDKIKIGFFLDLASEITELENIFTKFIYSLKDSGTRVVADPDKIKSAADKSVTHYSLLDAGLSVPHAIIIRNWEPTRRLNDIEKRELGLPFIVKPALGYGQRGVKLIKSWMSLREVAEARLFDPGDNFLLHEYITPKNLEGNPAWFRVFYIFGEIMICWWNPETGMYRQVNLKEFEHFRLSPLARISSEISSITGIEWFSCEIAVDNKTGKFTAIDYLNDQFDISSQSQRPAGVPDDLVLLFVQRLVEKAWQYKIGRFPLSYRTIWFPKMKLRDDGI